MLEFSNQILKRGYTIYISKNKIKSSLQGTYLKSFYDGIHPHELPQTELQKYNVFTMYYGRVRSRQYASSITIWVFSKWNNWSGEDGRSLL